MDKESAAALGGKGIDWALASKQHAGYVDALSKIVDSVEVQQTRRADAYSCSSSWRASFRASRRMRIFVCA